MNNNENTTETVAKPKNTRHLNIIIVVLSILCVFMVGKMFFFETILVQHTSMFPTIAHGDTVTLLKSHNIDRFDIIVFQDVEDADKKLIKRVIGLGGDTIEIDENGVLHITYTENGEVFNKSYPENYINSTNISIPPTTIPENTIYVLGDNRLVSRDSSEFGPVQISAVLGKIVGLDKQSAITK